MQNTPHPTATPDRSERPSATPSKSRRSCLTLLNLAALSLPGLAGTLAIAGESASWVAAPPATAEIRAGAGYVPTGASRLQGQLSTESTKQYKVSCYDDGSGAPSRLRLRIQGMTASAKFLVSAKIERNGVAQTVMDPANGDKLYGEYAAVSEGTGEYILTVSKVKKKDSAPDSSLDGPMTFQTMQECNTATGAYTGIKKPEPIGDDKPAQGAKLTTYSSALSKKANSQTLYVACTANKLGQDTARYNFQIKAANKNRPFKLRMTVKKDGEEVSVLDPINGDKASSQSGTLEGGNGKYEIVVSKDAASGNTSKAMSFAINHACETLMLTEGNLTVSKK